jgi:two-component system chemotaxis response regulator CheB
MKLSASEEEVLYKLVESLTGSIQSGASRKDVIARSIEKRMLEVRSPSLSQYLQRVEQSSDEFAKFVSNITIHTTSWFREMPHYEFLKTLAEKRFKSGKTLKIWSAACSTGEEAYSAALVLESVHPKDSFHKMYEIFGSDIDPICVKTAEKAIFQDSFKESIPKEFGPYLMMGKNKAKGFFTLPKAVRNQCHFSVQNLKEEPSAALNQKFEVIFLRNTLIYFEPIVQQKIIRQMLSRLSEEGVLILGHCDPQVSVSGTRSLGNSTYQLIAKKALPSRSMSRPKVLIIDDSETIRQALRKRLSPYFDIDESESAEGANLAIEHRRYDLVTLDLNLPGENGASWLKRNRQSGFTTPVIIISESSPAEAEKVFGALENGAQDYVVKSSLHGNPQAFIDTAISLTHKKNVSSLKKGYVQAKKQKNFQPEVVLLGSSTGGPDALSKLLANFPRPCPPIVLVQHISPDFAPALGSRLANISGLKRLDGKTSEPLENNCLYVASGDYHLQLVRRGSQLCIDSAVADKQHGHRPSVDVLFSSAAEAKAKSVTLLLTGMGSDGALGTQKIFESGCSITMVQDEESCVVFGMPKKALELDAVNFVGNIQALRKELAEILNPAKEKSNAA